MRFSWNGRGMHSVPLDSTWSATPCNVGGEILDNEGATVLEPEQTAINVLLGEGESYDRELLGQVWNPVLATVH